MSLLAEFVFSLLTLIFVHSPGYCMDPPKKQEEQSATNVQVFIPFSIPSFKEALALPEEIKFFIKDWQTNLNEASRAHFTFFAQIGSQVFQPCNNKRYRGDTHAGFTPYPDQASAFYRALFHRHEKLTPINDTTVSPAEITSFINRRYKIFGANYVAWLTSALLGEKCEEVIDRIVQQPTVSSCSIRTVEQGRAISMTKTRKKYVQNVWSGSQKISPCVKEYLQSQKLFVHGDANNFFAQLVPKSGNRLFYRPIYDSSGRGVTFFFQDGELKQEKALLISYVPGSERFNPKLSFGCYLADGTGFSLQDAFSDSVRQELIGTFFPQPVDGKTLYRFFPLPTTTEEWESLEEVNTTAKKIPVIRQFLSMLGYSPQKEKRETSSDQPTVPEETGAQAAPLDLKNKGGQEKHTGQSKRRRKKGKAATSINIQEQGYTEKRSEIDKQKKIAKAAEQGISKFHAFRKFLNLITQEQEKGIQGHGHGSHRTVVLENGEHFGFAIPHGKDGNMVSKKQGKEIVKQAAKLNNASY